MRADLPYFTYTDQCAHSVGNPLPFRTSNLRESASWRCNQCVVFLLVVGQGRIARGLKVMLVDDEKENLQSASRFALRYCVSVWQIQIWYVTSSVLLVFMLAIATQ